MKLSMHCDWPKGTAVLKWNHILICRLVKRNVDRTAFTVTAGQGLPRPLNPQVEHEVI